MSAGLGTARFTLQPTVNLPSNGDDSSGQTSLKKWEDEMAKSIYGRETHENKQSIHHLLDIVLSHCSQLPPVGFGPLR